MTKTEFISLYEKHLNGTATTEELNELLQYQDEFEMYIVSKEDDPEAHNEVKERILRKLEDSIGRGKVRHMGRRIWWWSAAAIFLFTTGALFFLKNKQGSAGNSNGVAIGSSIKPGINKAILTLANGKELILTDSLSGQLANQAGVKVNKTKQGEIVYTAANEGGSEPANQFNTLTTKRSEQFQVVLPDGTHVWIDAASSLKYPVAFTGHKRLVELTGQAYFEVTHNAAMPFIVKTAKSEVQVLGTHFNVSAYEDDQSVKTTLLEGSVRITSNNAAALLKPGQQAVLESNGSLTVNSNINVDREIAWKNGLFYFQRTGIKEIMAEASRWYDLNIKYEGKIPDTKLTGKISRNVDMSGLIGILQFEGIKLKIEGKNIIVSN